MTTDDHSRRQADEDEPSVDDDALRAVRDLWGIEWPADPSLGAADQAKPGGISPNGDMA